jgi:hypothetical protein
MRSLALFLGALLAVGALGGCGGDGGGGETARSDTGAATTRTTTTTSTTHTATETAKTKRSDERAATPATPTAVDPSKCLKRAGLSKVQQPAADVWRGSAAGGIVVRVKMFTFPNEAYQAVATAGPSATEQVDKYAIFGPSKSRDKGSVAAVARCLKGR